MRKLLFVTALGSVFSLSLPLPGSLALTDPPAWAPKADLAKKLAPETSLPRFTLQLPTGYKLVETIKKAPSPDQFRFGDTGTAGAKVTTARLLVIPDGSGTGWSSDDTLKAAVSRRTAALKNVTKSEPEHGTISGMPAVRMYIKGKDKVAGRPAEAHMFVYVIGDKDLTTVVAYDTAPNNKASLPLLEAAAMTLHPIAAPAAEVPATPPSAAPQPPVFTPDPAPGPAIDTPAPSPEPPVQTPVQQTPPPAPPPVVTAPQVNPGPMLPPGGPNRRRRPGRGGQQQPPGIQQQNPTAPMQPPALIPVQPPPGAGIPR